ncbi:MAG: SDR family NAD(P)-dependent oxidoreductase [Paracoccaceae bacterium]
MSALLAGKKCLAIGGGTGIGLGCARAFAGHGAKVFLTGRRAEVLAAAARGLGAGWAAGDATSATDMIRVTDAAAAAMGGIDTILVSAGTGGVTPIQTTSLDEFQSIVDRNLRPVFLAARYGAAHVIAAGGGAIIAISSMYGLVGQRERAAYCAAKAGVNGMVRSMALDLADKGVRVNAICPGFVETELALAVAAQEADPAASLRAKRAMHPIPRGATVEEIGALAVYLASDGAAFVTGQAIAADGGYTAR